MAGQGEHPGEIGKQRHFTGQAEDTEKGLISLDRPALVRLNIFLMRNVFRSESFDNFIWDFIQSQVWARDLPR